MEFKKDPEEVLDFRVDWGDWLESMGDEDTISSSEFTVGSGLTKDSESNTTTSATVFLSGGTTGERYTVKNEIVTAAGRTAVRRGYCRVVER